MYRVSETEWTRRFLAPLAFLFRNVLRGSGARLCAFLHAFMRRRCLKNIPLDHRVLLLLADGISACCRRLGAPKVRADADIMASGVMMALSPQRQLPTRLLAENRSSPTPVCICTGVELPRAAPSCRFDFRRLHIVPRR